MPFAVPMVQVSGGGGGSLPATLEELILDPANAEKIPIIDGDGIGRAVADTQLASMMGLGPSRPLEDPGAWTLPSEVAVAMSALTATLTVGGGAARVVGETGYAQRRTGCELVARLSYAGAPSSPTQVWAEVGLNDGSRNGFHFQLRGDGQLDAMRMPGFAGGSASGDPQGTWVRAVVTSASTVDTYYSTAVSRPTTEAGWTFIGTLSGVPADINALLHAGVASSAAVDAVAVVTDLTLRGWLI